MQIIFVIRLTARLRVPGLLFAYMDVLGRDAGSRDRTTRLLCANRR